MAYTANLRRQHEAILSLAAELVATLDSLDTQSGAASASMRLARLTGVLQIHLAAEDRALYPRMKASADRAAADTASRFMNEMGGLGEVYSDFESRWRSSSAILADPDQFRSEAGAVLTALGNRIERENAELYPLADAIIADPRRAA